MSSLQAFFAQNAKAEIVDEVAISDRFKDKDGKPGKKWYHYIGLDENELLSFSKASSKGKFVNLIMKYKNHDPAYGPTPTKKK